MPFRPWKDVALFYAKFNSFLFLEEVGRLTGLIKAIISPINIDFRKE